MTRRKPRNRAVTVGRPTVFTDVVLQKLEEAFAIDATVREACRPVRGERNNHGHTVIAYAKEDPNVRLYRTTVKDSVTDKETEKIGWDTTEKSKSFAGDALSRDLEDGACIPHAPETYEDLRTFVHGERGSMGGLPGKHDDRVLGLALANIAAKETGIGEILVL